MQERDLSPHATAVPLGHKLIAVIVAVGCGWGAHTWMQHRAMQSAWTAGLSFDAAAASRIDPGLGDAREPAVALAQSILSDQAIAGLSKQAYLASSTMTSRVGEFRSRLELTQPSPAMLQVRFHDTDPARAEATADAVAKALAAWTPSAATPAPAAAPQPAAPEEPAAAHAMEPTHSPAARAKPAAPQPDHSLSDALGSLEGQLAAANRQLDKLSAPAGRTRSGHRPYAGGSSYSQAKQQQFLRAEVRAAQKRLAALRVQHANNSPGAGIEGRLSEIQQALVSVWPASNPRGHGFNAAGTSASQLRRERSELTHVIRVVDKERLAIQRAEDAQGLPASDHGVSESDIAAKKPLPSVTGSGTNSPAQAPAAAAGSAAQTSAAAPAQPVPGATTDNPLKVVRLASPAAPPSPWPAVGAGLLCGLLYLGGAKWRYRAGPDTGGDDGYAAESTAYPQRFITPSGPVKAADTSASRTEAAPLASPPRQRAPFTFEAAPVERAPLRSTPAVAQEEKAAGQEEAKSPEDEVKLSEPSVKSGDTEELPSANKEASSQDREEEPAAALEEEGASAHGVVASPDEEERSSVHEEEPVPGPDGKSAAGREEEVASGPEQEVTSGHEEGVDEPAGHEDEPPPVAGPRAVPPEENIATNADPVTDRIRKALSETSIGSLFERSAARNTDGEPQGTADGEEHAKGPDRLAG